PDRLRGSGGRVRTGSKPNVWVALKMTVLTIALTSGDVPVAAALCKAVCAASAMACVMGVMAAVVAPAGNRPRISVVSPIGICLPVTSSRKVPPVATTSKGPVTSPGIAAVHAPFAWVIMAGWPAPGTIWLPRCPFGRRVKMVIVAPANGPLLAMPDTDDAGAGAGDAGAGAGDAGAGAGDAGAGAGDAGAGVELVELSPPPPPPAPQP